jgi:hypothetical protein
MYLANEFTLGELQSRDFSKVRLPQKWFINWQHELAGQDIILPLAIERWLL